MTWFEVIRYNAEERIDVVARSGFANPLSPKEVGGVLKVLADALAGKVASKLFEGLTALEINSEKLSISFTFSINPEHVAKVEAAIGRSELADHRVTFVMFVFASIDSKYRLDNSLPEGFRQTIGMEGYIQ